MSAHDEYRLTGADEARVLASIAEAIDGWRAHGWRGKGDANTPEILYRIAVNSIGCSDADLRDSERAWVRAEIEGALA